MNSYVYQHNEQYTPVSVSRKRRRHLRRQSIWLVVVLSVILAVLVGFAVHISVFGKMAHSEDGLDTASGLTHSLTLPDTVRLRPMSLPQGVPVEAAELVTGLEGTGITVAFAQAPSTELLGTQEVQLLFTAGNASCKKTVSVTRFRLVSQVTAEMGGEAADIRDFVPGTDIAASFQGTAPADIPADSCGSFELVITCDGREYPVTYLVTEDIAPEGVGLTVTTDAGILPQPEALVGEIMDHSAVTVAYAQEPDVTLVGVHEVTMVLTDEFGNSAQVTASLQVVASEDGPQFTGLEELHIQVGGTISYKAGVSCTDPQDGELTFTVDPGDVDSKTVGIYTAYYTATDADGHSLKVPRTIVIQDEAEAAVEEYARSILSEIITEDMTRDQKIYQVYQYTRKNILFVGYSDKSSIVRSAYEGFSTGKGDCYTYYAMNVVLLDMLGIENLEVTRVGGTSHHWWNLVLHEDGKYYHVDSCPKSIRLDGQTYYKMTDSDLDEYTYNEKVFAHRANYYVYDKTLPEYQDIDIAP